MRQLEKPQRGHQLDGSKSETDNDQQYSGQRSLGSRDGFSKEDEEGGCRGEGGESQRGRGRRKEREGRTIWREKGAEETQSLTVLPQVDGAVLGDKECLLQEAEDDDSEDPELELHKVLVRTAHGN